MIIINCYILMIFTELTTAYRVRFRSLEGICLTACEGPRAVLLEIILHGFSFQAVEERPELLESSWRREGREAAQRHLLQP